MVAVFYYEDGAPPVPPTCLRDGIDFYIQHNANQFTPQATSSFIQSACATTYKNQSSRWSKAEKYPDTANEATATLEKSKQTSFYLFPNPTASFTTLHYEIATEGEVNLTITNPLGVVVAEVFKGEHHNKGSFETIIDTQNWASGLYICTLQTADGVQTQKLMITK